MGLLTIIRDYIKMGKSIHNLEYDLHKKWASQWIEYDKLPEMTKMYYRGWTDRVLRIINEKE